MISKTKIKKITRKKTNPELVETINLCRKNKKWIGIARLLAYPRSKKIEANLDLIDKESKEGDIIVVPGKVLSKGNLSKKVRIVCLSISDKAKEKLKESKSEVFDIKKEIKENPDAKAVKIIKWIKL